MFLVEHWHFGKSGVWAGTGVQISEAVEEPEEVFEDVEVPKVQAGL